MITKQPPFLPLAAFLFLVSGISAQETARVAPFDRDAINEMFESYSRSFGETDFVELREYLQAPFVTFLEEPVVFENLDDVIQVYANLRLALEELDYDHSKIVRTRITALTPNQTFVKKTYHRFKKDGTLLQERSFVYIVKKDNGQWKVFGIFGQDFLDLEKRESE